MTQAHELLFMFSAPLVAMCFKIAVARVPRGHEGRMAGLVAFQAVWPVALVLPIARSRRACTGH